MIQFNRFTLDNGLRIIVHEDHATAMAAVNLIYDVGARDENPEKTGFAHLFEHLMFGGSMHIPQFDTPLQRVGGENNAFTSNDMTNYYITLPAENLETAFWLESDRMMSLAFSEKSLEVQRNVVIEEFKQRYLNQPYGTAWLRLRPLAYKEHPYRWATIGKEIAHIEQATITDVKQFFEKHYTPQNAIMVVTGAVKTEEVKNLAEKWFSSIPAGHKYTRQLPTEPAQNEERRSIFETEVPANNVYIALHMVGRLSKDYYAYDLLADLLSRGSSSRLYRHLVKEEAVFSDLNAYLTENLDAGLFVIEGKPSKGISISLAEEKIWQELTHMCDVPVPDRELNKVKNKMESTRAFAAMSILEKAMGLAYFELLGDANLMNQEQEKYLSVTSADINRIAKQLFKKEHCSTLIYIAKTDA